MFRPEIFFLARLDRSSQAERIDPARRDGKRCDVNLLSDNAAVALSFAYCQPVSNAIQTASGKMCRGATLPCEGNGRYRNNPGV